MSVGDSSCKSTRQQDRDILGEEDCRGKVVAQAEGPGYPVVPVEVLGINIEQIAGGQGLARRVQNVEGLVDQLAQLTKALVNGSDVGWLLARSLQRGA